MVTDQLNKRNLIVSATALAISTFGTSLHAQTSRFDALMNQVLVKHKVHGGSLAISISGKLAYAKGFGWADKERQRRVTPKSLFRISSVSKPITAVAIMKLVEQKKLRLDQRVYPLLGDLPLPPGTRTNRQLDQITVLDLLRHSSGQAIYNSSGRISSPMQPPQSRHISRLFGATHPPSLMQIAGYMRTRPLMHPVGSQYKYSNYGYALLGLLIERVSGQQYETFVKRQLLNPVGINDMWIGATLKANAKPNEVTYYDLPGSGVTRSVIDGEDPASFPYAGRHIQGWGAAGGWIASPVDIVRFVNHVYGIRKPTILNVYSAKQLVRQQKLSEHRKGFWYGLGWRVQQKRGGVHAWHNGASNLFD
jgi:N-acyl-D-amino-acid deacylase